MRIRLKSRETAVGGRVRRWRDCFAMIMLATLTAVALNGAWAQLATTTATLSGTVTDTAGALIPQATATINSSENGIHQTTTSNNAGHYSFAQLPPSTYTLTIQQSGFKEYEQRGIVLNAAQSALQDVTLVVGEQSQQVVVDAQASVLNTDNANIATDLSGKQVVELPLNLRNIYGLATLNSSVSNNSESQQVLGGGGTGTDNADQDISFLNFSGGYFGTTAFLLDGVWDTDPTWGAVIYVPSVDDVSEFKVQNNSFTAQYGWSTGNVINVTTKSGTSSFHGDIWEFYRNAALDANLWFNDYNGESKQAFTRNQVGVAAGGPLYLPKLYKQREKTFIYGVYEHLDLATPLIGTFTVPDQNFRAGNFAELLGAQVGTDALGRPIHSGQIYNPHSTHAITAGQIDPTTGLMATQTGYIRDPIAQNNVAALGLNALGTKLVSYYPNPSNGGLVNNFTPAATSPAASDEYSIRIDHNISDASRIYGRYSYKSEFKTQEPDLFGATNPAGPGNLRPNNRYSIAGGYTHIFSATLTMNLTAGYQYWNQVSTNQSKGFQPSTLGLPSHLDQYNNEFPLVTIGSQSPLGPSDGAENASIPPTTSAAADLDKILGKHTLSFGFMFVNSEENYTGYPIAGLNFNGTFTTGPNPDNPTGDTGNGLAQMLLGVLDGGNSEEGYNPAVTKRYWGGYLQDDYKPLRNLTLNMGLRYEIQGAPTYRHNSAAYFNPGIPNPIGSAVGETLPGALQFLSSSHRGVYDTDYTNWAPRIGFSYQAVPKLVLRGGFGIFYPPTVYVSTSNPGSLDGFSATTDIVSTLDGRTPNPAVSTTNPFPYGYVQTTGNSHGELQDVGYSVTSTFLKRSSPYTQQFMLGFQYAPTSSDVIDVSYVGNHGTHIPFGTLNRSQLNPQYLSLGTNVLNNLVPNPFYGHVAAGASSCSLDQRTIQYAHLLEPYPQYCGVTENYPPSGFDIYNALQANYRHRFTRGLSVMVSYTYSKFIDNTEGTQSWAYVGNSSPANNYNLAAEKSVDAGDTPQSAVINYIYDLPVGKGKAVGSHFNHATNAVLGGWEVSGIATFKSGIPISILGNNVNSYGGTPRPDLVGDPHAVHQSIHEWFNTAAFAYAPYGTFGNTPRYFSDLRAPGYQNFDTAFMKNWYLARETRLQFRAELFNTFNHPQFYSPNPNYGGCDPNASSSCSSGFGQITSAFPSREVQFSGKYYW